MFIGNLILGSCLALLSAVTAAFLGCSIGAVLTVYIAFGASAAVVLQLISCLRSGRPLIAATTQNAD